jgi:uncharacterized protein
MRICLLLPLAISLLTGCSSAPPDLPTGPASPPMWVVHDADTRIVILGSVHQLPPDLSWTGGRLATELRLADELVLELSPDESARAAALFSTLANDEPVASVATRFGGDAPEILRLLQTSGITATAADRSESWALALTTGNAMSRGHGLSSDHGVETVLTSMFLGHDLPISGLETARQQLNMFDHLTPLQQDAMVRAVLANRADSVARTRRLLAAWAAGDSAALATIAEEAVADTPFLVEPMIRARNRAWAAALINRLERPGDIMVAVGIGHLVGTGSLLDELRAREHRPMRLQ